jgi:Maltokinase N-terminal cap domain
VAVIHHTTLSPTKLELLAQWLPEQDWYVPQPGGPQPAGLQLSRAGGFRLDDPAGEVGIEFMIVLDGEQAYLTPMTYRGAALTGGADALIGTTEHGVLGTRWVYDGVRDPVLAEQVAELIQGTARAQAQSESDTPDLTVVSRPLAGVAAADLAVTVVRALQPGGTAVPGEVSATWTAADGTVVRGTVVRGTVVRGTVVRGTVVRDTVVRDTV